MDKQQILDRLRENGHALRARGVTHAALFGSRARGDDRPDSDIDILIDLAPEALSACGNIPVSRPYRQPFEGPVDVVSLETLKPCIRPAATADAVYAF
jgi:predicted nucleotidyltransferase